MTRSTDLTTGGRRRRAVALVTAGLVLAATLTACSSTSSTSTTTTGASATTGTSGGSPAIPASAFSDTTGLTADSVTLGNVSTLYAGLFKGSLVGTQAYAAYVNSTGGLNGRKVLVDSYDDGYQGAPNKQAHEQVVQKDFAQVGGFSLQDSYGETVMAANPGVPDVTVPLDQALADLPNLFSPDPGKIGWPTGGLLYFKSKYPAAVKHTASLVADQPSAITKWGGEKGAMESVGYNVIYDQQFNITQTDFTQNVLAMKQAGVQILFLDQMPANYAAAVIKALNQQSFHPVVVFGASTYSESLIPDAGGAAATNGDYLYQLTPLYLGEDATTLPSVSTFLSWVQKASPGFKPDLYTLFGWLSAQLFAQAFNAAGTSPTRGSVLQQLGKITSFNGNYLITTGNPAGKQPGYCYVMSRVSNGTFQRLDDPPVSGPTHGYRCDGSYYTLKS
jgi:ABC-type branched-subunit amino acid transport system substrate-binding protein